MYIQEVEGYGRAPRLGASLKVAALHKQKIPSAHTRNKMQAMLGEMNHFAQFLDG